MGDKEIAYKIVLKSDDGAKKWAETFEKAAAGVGGTLNGAANAAISSLSTPGVSLGGNFSQFAAARQLAEAEGGIGRGIGEFAGGFFGRRGEKIGGFLGEKAGKIAGEMTKAEIEAREAPLREAAARTNSMLNPFFEAGMDVPEATVNAYFAQNLALARRAFNGNVRVTATADRYAADTLQKVPGSGGN